MGEDNSNTRIPGATSVKSAGLISKQLWPPQMVFRLNLGTLGLTKTASLCSLAGCGRALPHSKLVHPKRKLQTHELSRAPSVFSNRINQVARSSLAPKIHHNGPPKEEQEGCQQHQLQVGACYEVRKGYAAKFSGN